MEKINFKNLDVNFFSSGNNANVFMLAGKKRVLKYFIDSYKYDYEEIGFSLEEKIKLCKKYRDIKSLVLPEKLVYDSGAFCGYVMKYIRGCDFSSKANLESFFRLCSIVKRCNDRGIIFPDLLTHNNIYISSNDSIRLIDFDGFQIENIPSLSVSLGLGDFTLLTELKKFSNGSYLFTRELDKLNLLLLYLEIFFRIPTWKIMYNLEEGFYLDELYDQIGLQDEEIQGMMDDTFSFSNEGVYADDIVRCIDKKYAISNQKLVLRR